MAVTVLRTQKTVQNGLSLALTPGLSSEEGGSIVTVNWRVQDGAELQAAFQKFTTA